MDVKIRLLLAVLLIIVPVGVARGFVKYVHRSTGYSDFMKRLKEGEFDKDLGIAETGNDQ